MPHDLKSINALPVQSIDLTDIIFDKADNVRDPNAAGQYDTETLQAMLETQGQQEPLLLYASPADQAPNASPRYRILKGFRRASALNKLAEFGAVYGPESGKLAGKPITFALAKVIKGEVTAADKFYLTADHSDRVSVDRVGFFRSVCLAFDAAIPDRDVVYSLAQLFNTFYPPKKDIKLLETEQGERAYKERLYAYHKGTMQMMKLVWESPYVFRDAYTVKLRGKDGQAWPKTEDIRRFAKIYKDERDADTTRTVNRRNPGPLWTAAYDAFLDKIAKAKAAGVTGRGVSGPTMMQRVDVETMAKGLESQTLRLFVDFIMRTKSRDDLPMFNDAMVKLESLATDDIRSVFAIVAGRSITPAATTDAPADDAGDNDSNPESESADVAEAVA